MFNELGFNTKQASLPHLEDWWDGLEAIKKKKKWNNNLYNCRKSPKKLSVCQYDPAHFIQRYNNPREAFSKYTGPQVSLGLLILIQNILVVSSCIHFQKKKNYRICEAKSILKTIVIIICKHKQIMKNQRTHEEKWRLREKINSQYRGCGLRERALMQNAEDTPNVYSVWFKKSLN